MAQKESDRIDELINGGEDVFGNGCPPIKLKRARRQPWGITRDTASSTS